MVYWIDGLFLLFLLSVVVRDTRRGLLLAVTGSARLLLSFVLAYFLSGAISVFIERYLMREMISEEMPLPGGWGETVSKGISVVLAFFLLLLAFYLLLRGVVPLVSALVKKIPLVNLANTLGGFVFGLLHALVLGWAVAFLTGHLLEALSSMTELPLPTADQTVIVSFFTHISPIRVLSELFSLGTASV